MTQDGKLQQLYNLMNNSQSLTNNPQNYQQTFFCKSRAVDPLLEKDGNTQRLSTIWPEWKERLKIESVPKEYFIQF